MIPATGPVPAPTVPPVTRSGAAQAARDELAKAAYHRHDPSIAQRVFTKIADWLNHLLGQAETHAPGGGVGLLVLVVAIVAAVVVLSLTLGKVRRTNRQTDVLFEHRASTPDEHRARARAHARDAEWALAVREWLRAVGRELEVRGVVDERPGRTASELCAAASTQLPLLAPDLADAARRFDAIWYGDAPATAADEAVLRALDARVAGPHRSLVPAARGAGERP
jgi:hypothetical protein